jgi:periplasmic glucans biosynthesis protein
MSIPRLQIQRTVTHGLIAMLMSVLALLTVTTAQAFELGDVAKKAAQLATQPYQPKASTLPDELKALTYDQYRDIRFKPERALWRKENLPFEAMFFHLGKFQTEPVLINEIDALGAVKHLSFNRDDFDYGNNTLSPQTWGDVGFAGFRLHYPVNTPAYKDEVIVFLGASYFRAVGSDQHYGLSARGLAIDTVGGQGEEFPRFSEFWIAKPTPTATSIVIYALMESKRATGAYRFEVIPGADTVTNVQSQLYLRATSENNSPIATLGIAPLTSMFAFGENQPHKIDFRPEVHDSDGLMVATGEGEWLWRPLLNPKSILTTSFAMRSLRGFGLMQRDQQFHNYEDTEARYEKRPSAWITPQGDWGAGRVELTQLPTPDETNDNIVAYWVPETLPAAGQPLSLAYQLRWQSRLQQRPPGAWVTQTRVGRGFDELAENEQQFIVDFKGGVLDNPPSNTPIKAIATADANGEIVSVNAYRNEANNTWRMALRVKQIKRTQPVELRAFLQSGNDTVSETWTNLIPAQ